MHQLVCLISDKQLLAECGVGRKLSAPALDTAEIALLFADFFTSAVQLRLPVVVTAIVLLYLTSFSFFGVVWYLVYRCVVDQIAAALTLFFSFYLPRDSCRLQSQCVRGFHGFVSAFIFATETQQTIGT